MEQSRRRQHLVHAPDDRTLRRIGIIAGAVLVALILVVVAIYAGAFLLLAPMMQ